MPIQKIVESRSSSGSSRPTIAAGRPSSAASCSAPNPVTTTLTVPNSSAETQKLRISASATRSKTATSDDARPTHAMPRAIERLRSAFVLSLVGPVTARDPARGARGARPATARPRRASRTPRRPGARGPRLRAAPPRGRRSRCARGRRRGRPARGLEIAGFIADQRRARQVEAELGGGLLEHAGRGLAAAAGPPVGAHAGLGVVRAEVRPVEPGAGRGEQLCDPRGHGIELGLGVLAAGDAGLVGGDDDREPGGPERRDRGGGARDEDHAIGLVEVLDLLVDHAVPIEEHAAAHTDGKGYPVRAGRGGFRRRDRAGARLGRSSQRRSERPSTRPATASRRATSAGSRAAGRGGGSRCRGVRSQPWGQAAGSAPSRGIALAISWRARAELAWRTVMTSSIFT